MKPTIEQTPCPSNCCKTPYGCRERHECKHHVQQHEANNRAWSDARKRHTSPKEDQ